jgi:heptosyltransferase-2/heptosyltransferase-3
VTERRQALRLAGLRLAARPLTALGRATRHVGTAATPALSPRIVLIRPDHLGDVLLATPTAAVLQDALPSARIDWLVGPWTAEVVRIAGGRGAVRTIEFPGFARHPKSSTAAPYAVLVREAARLRTGAYDAALVLRPDHWWGAMLAALAGIPRRFGFSVPECRPFLTDTLPAPNGHVVESNQALALLAGRRLNGVAPAESAILSPRFPVPPDDAVWARAWDEAADDRHAPLVAIHPGSGAPVKNWLPERWSAVAGGIARAHGARIVLTGGPGERALVGQVMAPLDPRPRVLVGETTLGQLAALFARCDLVVGGDSGPLHLAAAVGTPTLRLYGPTDVREFGPWPPDGPHVTLAAGLACQPCRQFTDLQCGARATPPCLRALNTDTVLAAVAAALRARRPIGSATAGEHARSEQR